MRKIVLSFLLFFAGCEPYADHSPSHTIIQAGEAQAARLQGEFNQLVWENEQLQNDVNNYNKNQVEFFTSLTDKQLKDCSDLIPRLKSTNVAENVIAIRQLQNILSDEQYKTLFELTKKESELKQRAIDIQNKYQTLQEQWERNRQLTMNLYLYQRQQEVISQQQNQQAWQNYYNQKRLERSLGGIENAIRNQQGNVIYLQAPPNPWQGFMEGLMQGAGLPPPSH